MPTIPTGKMERELRALYLRWLAGISVDSTDLPGKIDAFEKSSKELIERLGGQTARLGALAGFPAPKRLDLSPHVGTIYSDMQQAAIQAGMMIGQGPLDTARQMFNLGMDRSFNRLKRLARTETVSAYWKNAWDSVADLPALVMVWGSEDGPRTCAWCRERDGLVMDSPSLRDHPNGRCTPIPTLRSQVKYRGSISADGKIYMDPAWTKKPALKTGPEQSLSASMNGGYDVLEDLAGGTSSVQKVVTKDGRTLIVKSTNPAANRPLLDEEGLREELSSKLLQKMGVNAPTAERWGDNVVMEFVDGLTGWDYKGELNDKDTRLIGLFDTLTGNRDRHKGNWIATSEGRIVPIDNGAAWFYRDLSGRVDEGWFDGPGFAKETNGLKEIYRKGDYYYEIGKSKYTQAELTQARQALEEMAEEFRAAGKTEWLERMHQILDKVVPSD